MLVAGLKPDKAPRKKLIKLLHTSCNTKDWFKDTQGPCTRDLRLNAHLGAGGVITPGRIQDHEGAKTIVVPFETASGAITTIQRQTLRFVCFNDIDSDMLMIDIAATAGGKKNTSLQERRVMLIYKTHMHPEASLNPEHSTPKSDAIAKNSWL